MIQDPIRLLLDIACNTGVDLRQRRDAIANLALLIEKNSIRADRRSTYQEVLSRLLIEICLEESEKIEIINHLCAQLELEPEEHGLVAEILWALGKSDVGQSMIALRCILECALRMRLKESELRQAILSLDDLSSAVEDHQLVPLLPDLKYLRASIFASGTEGNRNTIDSYLSKLSKRNLRGV